MLLTVWLVYDRWFLFLGLSMTGQCLPNLVCLRFNLVHLVINLVYLVYLVYHLGFDCSLLYDAGSMPLALSWLDNVWQGVFLEHCCSTNIRLPLFCFDQKHNNLPVSMFYLTQVSYSATFALYVNASSPRNKLLLKTNPHYFFFLKTRTKKAIV